MSSISADTKRVAESDLHEPSGGARTAALADFAERVKAAIGEESATHFEWAHLATLRQSKWDTDVALQRMQKLSAFALKNPSLFEDVYTIHSFLE